MWEKSKEYLRILITVSLFSVGLWQLLKIFQNLRSGSSTSERVTPDRELMKAEISNLIFNIVTLAGYSENFGNIAVAVARHETGNYTSPIFKENNNLFGMRLPKQRDTTAIGKNRNYAKFDTLEDSIEDYTMYLAYFDYPKTFDNVADYVDYAKEKGYFTDTKENYLSALQRWIVQG